MNIETFQQRDKLKEIYNTFFNPDSETCIDFEVFNTLNFYGIISDVEFDQLTEKFEVISNDTFKTIGAFEHRQLLKQTP